MIDLLITENMHKNEDKILNKMLESMDSNR